MSGLEIAGLVLGAIPIAIMALERYGTVAEALDLFKHKEIKHDYKKCRRTLEFEKFRLDTHVKELMKAALGDGYDDVKISALLESPGGPGWKAADVSASLQKQLQGAYKMHMEYLQDVQETVQVLEKALLDVAGAIEYQPQQSSTSKSLLGSKDTRQARRIQSSFRKDKREREELISELCDHNDKLEKLFEYSAKDTKLKSVDTSICKFWKQAERVFRTVADAWTCRQQHQHYARLQLQHRTPTTHDLTLLFETSGQAPLPWEKRRARISKGTVIDPVTVPITVPVNVQTAVSKSRLPRRTPSKPGGSVAFMVTPPSTPPARSQAAPQRFPNRPITCLCSSLREMGQNCCGYISDDDYRYDVHPEAHKDHGWQLRVTLEEMLKAEPEDLRPTFRERYAVLLIVASSFVQLHGTPWLLETPTKSNIIFFRDAQLEGREAVNFNQPHVTSHFVSTPGESGPSSAVVIRSLQKLGILLIELCFGEFLEDKVYRSKHEDKAGTTDIEREAFDVMAAKDWWPKVEDQAGSWMSGAIKWCLESNQSVQGGSNEWREEMTRKVVHPLHEGWKTFWQPGREDGQVLGRTGSVGGP